MDSYDERAERNGRCPICGAAKELVGVLSTGRLTQCPIWRTHEREAAESLKS